MRLRLILALLFSLPCAVPIVAAQGNPKPNPKCDEVIVRDSSHPVWKELDAQYGRMAELIRKKDYEPLFALYMPDFKVKVLTGAVWGREQTLGFLRNGLAQVRETIHTSNSIIQLTLCGNEATAMVLQQWYRIQPVAGKMRRMETNGVQDEGWVKTPDGWRRTYIEELKGGAAFMDGKRIDTTKPADPEAPAYDPHDPRPKQPVVDALFQLIVDKGIESALQSYRALKQSNGHYVSEIQLNALGYQLLNMKKVREAIEIFKLNVEAYPQSANVYDSLGEAYMVNGDKELAIRNYQRAMELNPQNTNAIEMLKKLRAQ